MDCAERFDSVCVVVSLIHGIVECTDDVLTANDKVGLGTDAVDSLHLVVLH